MPRRLIPFIPELHYHIYNRGNNRERIFFEPENYLFFLKKIKEHLVPVADVLVYCLMPTHYHVVERVRETQPSEISKISEGLDSSKPAHSPISTAMMKLSVSYTKAINKRVHNCEFSTFCVLTCTCVRCKCCALRVDIFFKNLTHTRSPLLRNINNDRITIFLLNQGEKDDKFLCSGLARPK